MDVNEASLPVVVSLLDQIYDMRRRFHQLARALGHHAPEELRQTHAAHLARSQAE
jgi:chaperone modulatory protein CbpM